MLGTVLNTLYIYKNTSKRRLSAAVEKPEVLSTKLKGLVKLRSLL